MLATDSVKHVEVRIPYARDSERNRQLNAVVFEDYLHVARGKPLRSESQVWVALQIDQLPRGSLHLPGPAGTARPLRESTYVQVLSLRARFLRRQLNTNTISCS